MENNQAFKNLATQIRNFEEQLSWCDQVNKEYDKYGDETDKQIEEHFAQCMNALAARKEKLLRDLGEKIKEQKKNVQDTRAKLVATIEAFQLTLRAGTATYQINHDAAEAIWGSQASTTVQVSKIQITTELPVAFLTSIHNHGIVQLGATINRTNSEPAVAPQVPVASNRSSQRKETPVANEKLAEHKENTEPELNLLASFSFPTFLSLNEFGLWAPMLYARKVLPLIQTPQPVVDSLPVLNGLEFSLNQNGGITFKNPEITYRMEITPLDLKITNPQLHRCDGLQLLRGDVVEIGLSYDEDAARHFFYFPKSIPKDIILLVEQQEGITELEFRPSEFMAFTYKKELLLAYSPLVGHTSSNKTFFVPFEWDAKREAVCAKLPEGITAPLVVAFGISTKITKNQLDFLALFPWLYSNKSTISGEKQKHKHGKKLSLKKDSGLIKGHGIDTDSIVGISPLAPFAGESVHHELGMMAISISLKGVAEFAAPYWKATLTPNFDISNPSLRKSREVVLVRGDSVDVGLRTTFYNACHFFFFKKAPADFMLSLSTVKGHTSAEFNKKEKSMAFLDLHRHLQITYSAPVIKGPNYKTINLDLEWDAITSAIVVKLPETNPPPWALIFNVRFRHYLQTN